MCKSCLTDAHSSIDVNELNATIGVSQALLNCIHLLLVSSIANFVLFDVVVHIASLLRSIHEPTFSQTLLLILMIVVKNLHIVVLVLRQKYRCNL